MITFFRGIKEIKNFRKDYEDFKNKITAAVHANRMIYEKGGSRIASDIGSQVSNNLQKLYKEINEFDKKFDRFNKDYKSYENLYMRLDDLEKAFSKLEEHISQSPNKLTLPVEQVKITKKPKPVKLQAVEEEVKKVKSELTQAKVKRLFEYRDGELYWKVNIGNVKKGSLAGSIHMVSGRSHRRVGYKGKNYYISRIIFLMFHGYLPEYVAYIDGNSSNTRIENLREANNSQVQCFTRKSKNNTSGYKGVTPYKLTGKYIAQISKNRKHYHLGLFDTAEEAYKAYCKAAKKLHGEFARVA